MGITGLLPLLTNASRTAHVSEFRGGTVAIDSYCLLHKGANACAKQLALGHETLVYVDYCMKYVRMFTYHDIKPILVFDGRNLPAKAETEAKRRESRKRAKKHASELLKLGKINEAQSYLKQCIDVTPQMAFNLIKECRNLNIDCIVAPYESDAQLTFFNINGIAECIITEDSDLLVFGCKKVLYKLSLNGTGCLVEADKIYLDMKMPENNFIFDKFRYMCILSGCDYINSLNGIGLKKALKFLKLTAETNPDIFLNKIPQYLGMHQLIISDEYKKNVQIANATFLHQVVFNPFIKKLVHLTDPVSAKTDPEYLINAGDIFDDEKAYQLALGNLNPYTFETFSDWVPTDPPSHSIWSTNHKKRISKKLQKLNQKDSIYKYVKITSKSKEKPKEDLLEADTLIAKELEIYTNRSTADEHQQETEDIRIISEVKTKLKLSPIISKNPFLKKKISRFPRTVDVENKIVKSRFFSIDQISSPLQNIESPIQNNESHLRSNDFHNFNGEPFENDSTITIDAESEEDNSQAISRKRKFDEDEGLATGNESPIVIIDETNGSGEVLKVAKDISKRNKLVSPSKRSSSAFKGKNKQRSVLHYFNRIVPK